MTVTIDEKQPQGGHGWITTIRRGDAVAISVEAYPPTESNTGNGPEVWDVRLTVIAGRVHEGLYLSAALCPVASNALKIAATSLGILTEAEWRTAAEALERDGVFAARET